jgi:putative peptide zinc metalloprotease protein
VTGAAAEAKPASAAPAGLRPQGLPELRQDLRLIEGARDHNGARRWLIHDPLQHRFFAIGPGAHVLLDVWQPGATIDAVIEAAWTRHSEHIDSRSVEQFIGFLRGNGLTLESARGPWRGYVEQNERRRRSFASRMLHTYLFFKVPLIRPERFLDATIWFVRPLGSWWFAILTILTGAMGLYLVSREWEAFTTTFADVFSFEGAALLALSLPVVKLLHELGHAYTARYFGCRVPVIGVAFILGFPLLYADVTDVWRLKSRRQRMWVDSAGILVDLAVAAIATFLWAFLPPGPAKSLAFSLATAGWLLSLAMNLNPFMKFDGYHIAADMFGVDNMQSRALNVARWRMRELLFGLGLPPPEPLSPRANGLMALYGAATAVYRVILFTGIALAVYHFFFKVAGVILFLVEIGYFIVAPAWRELKEWYAMRKAIARSPRAALTVALALGLIALMVIPWSSRVAVPAVLESGGLAQIYPVVPAEVTAVHVKTGDVVRLGAPLLSLAAPALDRELALTELKTELVRLRQSRRASDITDRDEAVVLDSEYASLIEKRDGLLKQKRELEVTAPFAGVVVELAGQLHAGRWINLKEPLAVISADAAPVVRGYIDAAAIWRVAAGSPARFIPNDILLPAITAEVTSIAQAGATAIDQVELVAEYGGKLATRLDQRRNPVPVTAQYSLRAAVKDSPPVVLPRRTVSGTLIVEGAPESLLAGLWRQTLKVLVRESGV